MAGTVIDVNRLPHKETFIDTSKQASDEIRMQSSGYYMRKDNVEKQINPFRKHQLQRRMQCSSHLHENLIPVTLIS